MSMKKKMAPFLAAALLAANALPVMAVDVSGGDVSDIPGCYKCPAVREAQRWLRM